MAEPTPPSNRGYKVSLKQAEADVAEARAQLASAYRRRTEAVQRALDAGMTKQAIADELGVVRPAVNKILAGQTGEPARKGWSWEGAER